VPRMAPSSPPRSSGVASNSEELGAKQYDLGPNETIFMSARTAKLVEALTIPGPTGGARACRS
jgi:hypothetical protein